MCFGNQLWAKFPRNNRIMNSFIEVGMVYDLVSLKDLHYAHSTIDSLFSFCLLMSDETAKVFRQYTTKETIHFCYDIVVIVSTL